LIVLAGICSVSAGIVRAVHAAVAGVAYPFPSVADLLYLCSYLLFITAILRVVRLRVDRLSGDAVLDAAVGLLAAGLLQWTLVLIPYLRAESVPPLQKAANISFSVLTLVMVGAAVLALVVGSTPTVSNRLLALGLAATFATDIAAVLVSAGRLPANTEIYPAFLVIALAGLGIMHPSVNQLVDRPTGDQLRRRLTRRLLTVLALALLTPPALMLVAAAELSADPLVLLPAITSLALTPLVVTRLGRLVRQNEELAALETSLRGVGEHLVGAETADDISRIIGDGAEQVLRRSFIDAGLVVDPRSADAPERSLQFATLIEALQDRLAHAELPANAELIELPGGPEGHHVTAGMVVLQGQVVAALLLVTAKHLSDDESNAVTTLCRNAAIALRAVEQTELLVRRRSEERFAGLIDNSSDIVTVLGPDLSMQYVSPVAQRLLGYPLSDLIDRDVLQLVHPEDLPTATAMLHSVHADTSDTVELRLRHLAGAYHWFEVVGTDLTEDPNIGGVVLNLREIGDRKQAEERLVLSEAWFKALVQNSTDLVIVVDADGLVRYASPSVEEGLGTDPGEVLDHHIDDVLRDSSADWQHLLHDDGPATQGSPALSEFTFRRGIDDWRTLETTITDLRDEPAVGGFVLNARDVTERKTMEQRLRYQATHDELTGLANRVQAVEQLAGMLGRNSGRTTVAAILLGIDDFKEINDSLGHAFGDKLLNVVAGRITALLGFGDVAARVGGDEFVVALERAHGENHVTDLAAQMLSAIAQPCEIDGREFNVTASAGIVFDHDRTNTGEILLRNADIAMYRAKTMGKRRSVVFETQMHVASFDRLELRADLARAIAGEQFVAHYQPVVDIETRRIVGAEALIRWEHPQRGLVGPGLFIPLAEETGMINELGKWVLQRACTDLARWRSQMGPAMEDFTISVNLSVQQLHDRGIVSTVRDILERTHLPAERLVLEVTESTLITETDRVRATMQDLRMLGSHLAVDDFGTGYSSLGYIQQFEFDVLKIDKSFVDGLESGSSQQIVAAVLELAGQLGVRTIAEGIETEQQDEVLRRLGCRYGQGYLYSRPLPGAAFQELLTAELMDPARHAAS